MHQVYQNRTVAVRIMNNLVLLLLYEKPGSQRIKALAHNCLDAMPKFLEGDDKAFRLVVTPLNRKIEYHATKLLKNGAPEFSSP